MFSRRRLSMSLAIDGWIPKLIFFGTIDFLHFPHPPGFCIEPY